MKMRILTTTAALFAASLLAGAAEAGVIINFTQEGDDVMARANGWIDLNDLSFDGGRVVNAAVGAYTSYVVFGPPGEPDWSNPWPWFGYYFAGDISGPADFGGGDFISPTSVTGEMFGFWAPYYIIISFFSSGYIDCAATWENSTIGSLGLDPGTYVYTWGSGDHADSITVNIVAPAAVAAPEPSSLAMAGAGIGLAGIASRFRTSRKARASG